MIEAPLHYAVHKKQKNHAQWGVQFQLIQLDDKHDSYYNFLKSRWVSY